MADPFDAPVAALFHPFHLGALSWPTSASVLFVGARAGEALLAQEWPGLVCEQDYKPDFDALSDAGLRSSDDPQARHAMVLLLPPRQRDHARASYVRALERLVPGGVLVVSQANREGARSCEADVQALTGPLRVVSKHQCRVFWTGPDSRIDTQLAALWRELDAPRTIAGGRYLSRPGVFAWDHIDPASHLLAEHLPADLDGAVADLGAGFGYLASEILQHCPNIAALDLYEADARALDLARQNLAQTSTGVQPGFHWHDVTTGLPRQYQHIVSNPPFHAQRSRQRIDIGQAFLAAAAAALLPGGQLWLVANRHLPYEALLADRFDEVRTLAQTGAYKVINARRAGGQRLQLRPRLRDQTDSSSEWRPRKRQQASDPGRRRR